MTYLIVHPDNQDKLTAVKAVLKALKVDFDETKTFYGAEFAAKIAEGGEDIKAGNTVKERWTIYGNRIYPTCI